VAGAGAFRRHLLESTTCDGVKNPASRSLGTAIDSDPGGIQPLKGTSSDPPHDDSINWSSVQRCNRMAHAVSVVLIVIRDDLELSGIGIKEQEERGRTEVQ